VTPLFDEAGELVNHVGIQQDVTTVRESQRELRAERERFELLLETTDEYAFLTVDNEGLIQTWNDSAANLFGYDETAALGMPIQDLHTTTERAERAVQTDCSSKPSMPVRPATTAGAFGLTGRSFTLMSAMRPFKTTTAM